MASAANERASEGVRIGEVTRTFRAVFIPYLPCPLVAGSVGGGTAAKGRFPYNHRTQEQVRSEEAARSNPPRRAGFAADRTVADIKRSLGR